MALVKLRNELYRTRVVKFHWDLDKIVETRLLRSEPLTVRDEEVGIAPEEGQKWTDCPSYDYPLNAFVTARSKNAENGLHFLVGEIVNVYHGRSRKVGKLSVKWYRNNLGKDIYTSAYNPYDPELGQHH